MKENIKDEKHISLFSASWSAQYYGISVKTKPTKLNSALLSPPQINYPLKPWAKYTLFSL